MSEWDYQRITHAQHCWSEARRKYPPLAPVAEDKKPLPIEEGRGPQMVKR